MNWRHSTRHWKLEMKRNFQIIVSFFFAWNTIIVFQLYINIELNAPCIPQIKIIEEEALKKNIWRKTCLSFCTTQDHSMVYNWFQQNWKLKARLHIGGSDGGSWRFGILPCSTRNVLTPYSIPSHPSLIRSDPWRPCLKWTVCIRRYTAVIRRS